MSVLTGIIKIATAIVASSFAVKTSKKGYDDIKTKISSNNNNSNKK